MVSTEVLNCTNIFNIGNNKKSLQTKPAYYNDINNMQYLWKPFPSLKVILSFYLIILTYFLIIVWYKLFLRIVR